MDAYHEHILEPPDVCANCLSVIAEERVDPIRTGIGRELDSHYSRDPQRTSVEFAPHECPPRSKGVFCECGVEGHRVQDRLWSEDDVDDERFRELLKAAVRTLEEKGVTIRRDRMLAHALDRWHETGDVDEALAHGLDVAIATATASGSEALEA